MSWGNAISGPHARLHRDPPRRAISDQFAREVVDLLGEGINAMVTDCHKKRVVAARGSPVKKQKAGEE